MKTIIFLIISWSLLSCSSPTEITNTSLTIKSLDEHLEITNHHNRTIYFFLSERGSLALINWTTHFGEPNIPAYSKKIMSYENIYNSNSEPVSSGDELVITFWDDSNKNNPKINSVVIKL